jgi:hypothetical protein
MLSGQKELKEVEMQQQDQGGDYKQVYPKLGFIRQ